MAFISFPNQLFHSGGLQAIEMEMELEMEKGARK